MLKEFGLLSYSPHRKQELFHQAGNFKRRMVKAGNRFGKSQMGAAEDCSWLLGERPWYSPNDPLRRLGIPQRPNKGLIITTDFDLVDEVWTGQRGATGKLWRLLPKDFVKKTSRNSQGIIDRVLCKNGSSLTFYTVKGYQNDPLSCESADWDFIHVDEPIPEQMWKATSRGLIDRYGSAWFTLTPLREPWMNDMFFPRQQGKESSVEQVIDGEKWAIRGSIYDNPYLNPDAIKLFEDSLTDDEKQCRLYGLDLSLAGLVYKEFDWDKHVLKTPPLGWSAYSKPPKLYTVHLRIDPHPQTPHAVLFCAVAPGGQLFFYDEIFEQTSIKNLTSMIYSRLHGNYLASVCCDPFAWINSPTGATIAEEFANCGLLVEKATKDLRGGIIAVKEALSKPGYLNFSPHLRETLWEFTHYSWDKENKPIDKDDHMMENLYRFVIDRINFVDTSRFTNAGGIDDLEVTPQSLQSV